ncbi:hypothetical protein ACSBL2_07990 [Pedobacter sp. AW31-3R]|uniref:hypothetical protein n=1 Tax=Pedobacter sp. AW31-3R TaxID=3445781 RepID=UPI003FA0E1BD
MGSIKGRIRLVYEQGLEVEYASELYIIWMIKKGSIIKFPGEGIIEIIEIDTYFKDQNNLISFLVVAQVRLLFSV